MVARQKAQSPQEIHIAIGQIPFTKRTAVMGKEQTMSIKEYKEYSYVLMKLWIGNLITDGEYNRIMDRVNAVWRQTEGADDEA